MTIKEIRTLSGLTQKDFSKKYGIPTRTLQGWELVERIPPKYVINLLERVVRIDVENQEKS